MYLYKMFFWYHYCFLEPNTFTISPQPISLKLLSTLLLIAILSPIFAHTGFVNSTRTLCYLTDITLAPRDWLPTLIISISSALKELTLFTLWPSSALPLYLTPRSLFNKKYETSISLSTSGIKFGWPIICPTKESALVMNGSTLIPTPISPPGTAYIRAFLSALSDVICDWISFH